MLKSEPLTPRRHFFRILSIIAVQFSGKVSRLTSWEYPVYFNLLSSVNFYPLSFKCDLTVRITLPYERWQISCSQKCLLTLWRISAGSLQKLRAESFPVLLRRISLDLTNDIISSQSFITFEKQILGTGNESELRVNESWWGLASWRDESKNRNSPITSCLCWGGGGGGGSGVAWVWRVS